MSKIGVCGAPKTAPATGDPEITETIADANVHGDQIETITFEDENLKILEKNISLTEKEKLAINKLNKLNAQIIENLNNKINQSEVIDYLKLEEELNQKIVEEKKIIQEELIDFIEKDKSGRKLLKIFEAIVASEMNDKNFSVLQQKKAVSLADYFVNKQITDMEQANYICEKGIVEKRIECAEEKMSINKEEYQKLKVILTYEKILLNNYNKARSNVKDDYFKNSESKELVPTEIVVIVTNEMPKQASKLLLKLPNLSIQKENELEAIIKLMSTQQLGTLMMMAEKIPDGKLRKIAIKKIKEIRG